MTERPGDPSPATAPEAPARKMTPEAALGRHVEWLEFALAAARSEETWRVARLDKANKRNRDRRATRLDEVRDEIEELDALLVAIRELQARPAPGGILGGTEAGEGPAAQDDDGGEPDQAGGGVPRSGEACSGREGRGHEDRREAHGNEAGRRSPRRRSPQPGRRPPGRRRPSRLRRSRRRPGDGRRRQRAPPAAAAGRPVDRAARPEPGPGRRTRPRMTRA